MQIQTSINQIIYRETGSSDTYYNSCHGLPMHSDFEPTQVTFKTHISGQSPVWVGSRYNLVIILDSRGRVTMNNTLLKNKGSTLINSPDHAFKFLMSDDCLYIIYKQSPSNLCTFLKYHWSDLQISKLSPAKILQKVQVSVSSIIELNDRDLIVTLVQNQTLEIWSLESESLLEQFSYSPELNFRYQSQALIFYQTSQSSTSFGVLIKGQLKTFSFNLSNEVYFCELVQEKLVIGMKGCHLQIVDIKTLEIQVLSKGVPKQVFYLPINESVFAVFPNDEVCVIDNEAKFFKLKGQNFTCCETEGQILVSSQDGFSYLNWVKVGINKVGKRLAAIGINPDTRQIVCAEKGQVHIFE